MPDTKLNLHQKLIEIRRSCPYLKKENSGFQFKYVSSSQVILALKEQMDKQGVLLTQEVVRTAIRDHTTKKENHEYFTEIWVKYTWINAEKPDQTLTLTGYGQGLDDGEKGVGKAMTYAEKYFFLKQFNIPTDKDDPDANQLPPPSDPNNTPPPAPKPPETAPADPNGPSSVAQLNEIARQLSTYGIVNSDILKFVSQALQRDVLKSNEISVKDAILCIKTFRSAKEVAALKELIKPPAKDPGPDPNTEDDLPF